jgi:hypothetical protein
MFKNKLYADTRLVKFLQRRVLELKPRKSQLEIAAEAGFRQPNLFSMIKTGTTRMPLDRVPAIAKALECDPTRLFMLALEQRGGDTTDATIRQIFGTLVSENEVDWLIEIREASGHADPRLTTRARSAIRGIFGK